ncbi:hypothetical protein PPACK8108_LOCUS9531 [Phakopsora pachyrhizi]|uniref:Uncharacterized protein n=1 Tax=Phakopsora pachyrhizi TaxID=170000 RepID=A0AAV0AYL1_PHAPC|nr:hypothetical protein PPACK8108_LOCUS9531 [Phakopsora pachyrhizi]
MIQFLMMNRVRQWMDGWMDGEEGREVVQDGGDHQTKVVVVVVVVVRMMMIAVGIREFDEIDGYMKPKEGRLVWVLDDGS